jgi:hypothetical protein
MDELLINIVNTVLSGAMRECEQATTNQSTLISHLQQEVYQLKRKVEEAQKYYLLWTHKTGHFLRG